MKIKIVIAITLSLLILVTGFFAIKNDLRDNIINKENDRSNNESLIILGNITSFDDAVNVFGFNLFRQMNYNLKDNSNIFYSPYSVFTALAMTYEGARNDTLKQMREVLKIEQGNASFHQYMKVLYEYLNQNGKYNISTANALWIKENLHLLEEYTNIIKTFYYGELSHIDFSDTNEASNIINLWINSNTNGLIKDLIKREDIDPIFTALILTNAIYFKGMWEVQFDPNNTTEKDFKVINESKIRAPTMQLINTDNLFNYTENDDLQILELPYSGNDISMVILLPKKDIDLSHIISLIDNDKLKNWIKSMSKESVDIYLPKFKIETPTFELKDYLISLGMNNPFTNLADFSGITGSNDLYIEKILHKAFIEVNEEGTEAAAATVVEMRLTVDHGGEESIITFNVDHPFLFLIQQKDTGTVLFMGKVINPIL